ncbi:MAG: hypothetical protein K2X81_00740, partial [Candidatus Obscuribacterales bacterium]|nr:hypothetical protein [Candidatus Obscuribacterales bacterium]
MVNEVVHETKDAAKADCCNNDNGMSFLSIVESAGKSAASALQKVQSFGSGVVSGSAAALGIHLENGTSDSIARGAVMLGLGGAGAIAAEQAIKHPGATAAIAGGVAGAVAVKALETATASDVGKAALAGATAGAACAAECAGKEIQKVAKDAVIGGAIGAVAGAATGDATRAVTLAAMGAVTGAAARCAAEMCKPCCGVKPVG